jgi:RimJ/RimL family protein N-acetyltransferase
MINDNTDHLFVYAREGRELEKMCGGLKLVKLDVFSINERAIHVYEKVGFKEVGSARTSEDSRIRARVSWVSGVYGS